MQSRWNSPVLRSGLVALLYFICKDIFNLQIPNETLATLIDVIFYIIFGVSVANNPVDKEHF